MALLELKDVQFSYSDSIVVKNLNLTIEPHQILSIMGPSGCGKSTLLRILAGLEKPNSGLCLFKDEPIDKPSGMLRFSFQDYDAFPWKTVRENLLVKKRFNYKRNNGFNVNELLEMIGLKDHAGKYPAELSGGMRKRLALGRCLAGRPEVILLDEPFSSLDLDARQEMYQLLQSLWVAWKCLIIIVTHDVNEAVFLSHKVIVSGKLPFCVSNVFEIPFPYPRENQIINNSDFQSLSQKISTSFVTTQVDRLKAKG